MKKLLSFTLAAIMLAAALVGCASAKNTLDPQIRITSSDAVSAAEWLDKRLDVIPDRIVMGTSADGYGIDVSGLENDGYVIRNLAGEVALFAKTADGLDRAVRKYAKMTEAGTGVEDITFHEGYRIERLTIAGNEISRYTIVIPDDAESCVKTAANELASYIRRSCGADLNILTETQRETIKCGGGEKCIIPHVIVFTSGNEALGDEGFTITVDEAGDLHIDGGVWRGCLFAVYSLLEDIGWRFLSTDIGPQDTKTFLYESEHVDLDVSINRTEIPSIPIRGGLGGIGQKNTYSTGSTTGGYGFARAACHGLQSAHSIIFSGEYEGLYDGVFQTNCQPCFSDELIIEAIENYALNYVQTRLDAGQQIGRELVAVDISQCDVDNFCGCKECRAVEKVEGSASGPMVRMANRVAKALDEAYPGMYVSILAYWGTDILPKKTVPAHNMLVAYCFYVGRAESYAVCGNHCISGEECFTLSNKNNAMPGSRFKEWAAAIDPANFQIWYYPLQAHTYTYAVPILMTLYKDIRFLAEYKVGQIYLCSGMLTNGLVNVDLWRYLCAKLSWNADMTEEEYVDLIREWFDIVYGDAGDALFNCAMLTEKAGDQAGCWCAFFYSSLDRVNYDYLTPFASDIRETCEAALLAADSASQEEMIERYTAGMLFLAAQSLYDESADAEQKAEGAEIFKEAWTLFRKHSLDIYRLIEGYHVGMPDDVDFNTEPMALVYEALDTYVQTH